MKEFSNDLKCNGLASICVQEARAVSEVQVHSSTPVNTVHFTGKFTLIIVLMTHLVDVALQRVASPCSSSRRTERVQVL